MEFPWKETYFLDGKFHQRGYKCLQNAGNSMGGGVNSVGNCIGRGSYCWKFHVRVINLCWKFHGTE